MKESISKVLRWAEPKGLLNKANSFKQFTKVVEEVGEIAAALCRGDKKALADAIGDVIVTLIILAYQNGLTLPSCLDGAISEIIDRKGKTINGIFIKSEDLNEPILKKEDLKESDFIGDYYNEEGVKQ